MPLPVGPLRMSSNRRRSGRNGLPGAKPFDVPLVDVENILPHPPEDVAGNNFPHLIL